MPSENSRSECCSDPNMLLPDLMHTKSTTRPAGALATRMSELPDRLLPVPQFEGPALAPAEPIEPNHKNNTPSASPTTRSPLAKRRGRLFLALVPVTLVIPACLKSTYPGAFAPRLNQS